MNENHQPVVSLERLTFRWPGQDADIVDIDELSLQPAEHLFVRGSSGSGKTTLLNLLAGVHTPTGGIVRLLGSDLAELSASRRDQFRADHIGVIFQQFNLLPYLTTMENVTIASAFGGGRSAAGGDAAENARRLLHSLNVAESLHSAPVAELSVGQQQRVAVARALMGEPELVIADEPTSALDADNRDRFLDLLFHEAVAQGCTLVFVSHDRALAERFDQVIELTETDTRHGRDA